MQNKNSLTKSL